MFWQRWQCYILCWGKPRHSVPSLWASALSRRAPFDTSRSIKHTRSINKFVCTYENHNTTNRIMILHVTVQRRPPPPPPPKPPSTYPNRISRSPWRSHASCVSPVALWNKFHILWHRYCYMLQSLVLIGGKKQKHFMFVCTIMLSWHWIKRIKEENSRNKAELKDRKARCIKPVWLKIMAFSEKHESEMKEEERVESEGLSSFLLHYRAEYRESRVRVGLMSALFSYSGRNWEFWVE